MNATADPLCVAAEAARVFAALRIPYLIGGSLASTLHGEPRGTFDVDFAADVPSERAAALAAALAMTFFVEPESVREAAREKRLFNAIHKRLYVKLDVHVREPVGHFASELARARIVTLEGDTPVPFATPEDVLVKKLWWYRRGGEVSDRQWRDVLGVLRSVGARLDVEYCRRWSGELGTQDLFARACAEVERES